MPKDFKASQIRTSALVASGAQSGKPGLLIYSASDASNFEGGYQTDMLTNVGTDVFFFVSGSKNTRTGVSVFGGDVVVSGTMYMEKIIAEVDSVTDSDHYVSGSLIIENNSSTTPAVLINLGHGTPDTTLDLSIAVKESNPAGNGGIGFDYNPSTNTADVVVFESGGSLYQSASNKVVFHAGKSEGNAYQFHAQNNLAKMTIFSGSGAGNSPKEDGTDVNFYVSGTIGSRGSAGVYGTAVFGGDLVVSGALTDGQGTPIISGEAALVGWHSGSSAVSGQLGQSPNFISTSGSLVVTGNLETLGNVVVGGDIFHRNDSNTGFAFSDDEIQAVAGGVNFFKLDENTTSQDEITFNQNSGDIDFIVKAQGSTSGPAIKVDALTRQVLILSGGAAGSPDEALGADVSLFVSGSTENKNSTTHRGTSVFGGDVVISGSLTDGSGNPIAGAGGGNIGWATGSAGFEIGGGQGPASFISTTGSLVVTGTIKGGSLHINETGGSSKTVKFGASGIYPFVTINDSAQKKFTIGPHNYGDTTTTLSVSSDSNNPGAGLDIKQYTNTDKAGDILFYKGRGSYASMAAAQDGDEVSNFYFVGHDTATSAETGAKIEVVISGTVGEEKMPMEMRFLTRGPENTDVAEQKLIIKPHRQVLILSGGSGNSYDEASAPDVSFYVSGTVGSRGTTTRGTTLFGGDLALSGTVYGTKTRSGGISGHNKELDMVADVITFGRTTSESLGNEVFFFVSGTSPDGGAVAPSIALFDGKLVTSGNINVIQNYPTTGSQLVLSNITQTSGDGGSTRIDLVAGESPQTADNSKLQILKFGPNNLDIMGGPWANLVKANSGSLVFMVGSNQPDYLGNQSFSFRDSHGTFFLTTTGSVLLGDQTVYFLSGGAASSPNLVGRDTNYVVSGAIGSAGGSGINRGTAVFGGDLVVSGAMKVRNGAFNGGSISGSIHQTAAGKSYLIAGDNVTVSSASDGSITIGTSGGGGSSTFKSGSTTIGSVTSIDVTRLGLLTNLGSGEIAITGTIGPPEDGSYSDGLFTTFDADTQVGHAIDKINEVLFYLSPSPAPNLSKIGNDGLAGTSPVLLSIAGTNIGGSSYTPVSAAGGIGSAVAVNGTYQITTASNNVRMGVFTSLPTITGHLADGTAANAYTGGVINHSGSAFGDADLGTLKLEINGTIRQSVDLSLESVGAGNPGSGTDSQVDGNNNGFFNLSQTGSAVQANGQPFGLFKYRTGKVRIGTNYQRTGWNYARVVHTVNSVDRNTNQFEWFVDTAGTNPTVNSVQIQNITLSGSKFISGIQYATGAQGDYTLRIDNFYDHVYAANNITFTTANVDAMASKQVPEVPAGTGGSYLDPINLSERFQLSESSISDGTMVSGSATFNMSVVHPTKNNMVNTGSITSSRFLIYSASSLASDQFEDFVYEDNRIVSGSYNQQSDVVSGITSGWNSQLHLTSSTTGQSDGLAVYAGKLKPPVKTTAQGGNFTIFNTNYALGQGVGTNQPNYSSGGGATGTKTFFRAFKNNAKDSGGNPISVNNFMLSLTGSGTIVSKDDALSTTNIRVYAKNPQASGYLDLGQRFKDVHLTGQWQVDDYDGLHVGTFTNSVTDSTTTNYGSFGTGSIPANGYVVLKVEADSSWTGDLAGMNMIFPAYDPTSIVVAPALDEIDITTPADFVSGKLSFGNGKSGAGIVADYINVTGSGGPWGRGTDIDFNESYSVEGSSGQNKRYGINSSNGSVEDVIGDLNGDVNASGNNYTADAFRAGTMGTLSLYVNASGSGVAPIHTLTLSSFAGAGSAGNGTASSVNGNGSGFTNISVPTPASSSGGLPDFTNLFRTAKFKVAGADQNAKGWNWAQVVHSYGGAAPDEVTTFVEWVNDDDGDAIDIPSSASGSFNANSYYHQSGVKYFDTTISPVATGTVGYRISDAYTNVYSSSPTALQLTTLTNVTAQGIFVTGSSVTNKGDVSLSSNGTSLPSLTADGSVTSDIHVTGTLTYTGGTSLPGDSSPLNGFTTRNGVATLTVDHPIDSNASQAVTILNFLAYSGSAGSSNINTTEKFTGEFYRMQSGSFTNQAASGSLKWNSQASLVGGDAGHNTGLLIYGNDGSNGYLVSPKSSALPNSGDFRLFNDLTSPQGNVNYSATSGEKHFFRTFKNNTTSDQAVISLSIKGDATLVPRTGTGSGTLGSNKNIFVFVKIPGKTGWLDVAKAADGTISDGGGSLQGDRDSTIDSGGASNEVTFSTAFVGGDPLSNGSGEHFCLAIHADAGWTGNIKEIVVTF